MVKLINPLTTKERLSVTRLIEHDMIGDLSIVSLNIQSSIELQKPIRESVLYRLFAVSHICLAIRDMSQKEYLRFYAEDAKTEKNVSNLFKSLSSYDCGNKVNANIKTFCPFLTNDDMLYCAISNLLKNSQEGNSSKDKPIELICDYIQGFPENPCFVPEGARDYKKFMAFRVHDSGRGFPSREQKAYESYFTKMPKKGEHGFGLYFTGLVAKVLRAPVEIASVPGDTTVSFYHPVYPKENE